MSLIVKNRVTLGEVCAVPTPLATKSYQPVPNKELLELLPNIAQKSGLTLVNPQFGLARMGQRLFGMYEVEGQSHFGYMKLMLGVRNSYDKSMSVGVCFGSNCIVCDNMAFTGYACEENGIKGLAFHKHTVNVEEGLVTRLNNALVQFSEFKNFQEKFYSRLGDIDLKQDRAYAAIVRASKFGAINKTDIQDVADEWDRQGTVPTNMVEAQNWHSQFRNRNAMNLFQAFTEIHKDIQGRNLVDANKRSIQLTSFFHREFCKN